MGGIDLGAEPQDLTPETLCYGIEIFSQGKKTYYELEQPLPMDYCSLAVDWETNTVFAIDRVGSVRAKTNFKPTPTKGDET